MPDPARFHIRLAQPADAVALSAIVLPLIGEWLVPDGDPAAMTRMQREHSLEAIAAHLVEGWPYWLAEHLDSAAVATVLGYIALKPPAHLFNLYVWQDWHGRGVGYALWQQLHQHVQLSLPHNELPPSAHLIPKRLPPLSPEQVQPITVNASLRAQSVYQHWGFVAQGAVQCHEGLWFQPMRFPL